MFKTDRLKAVAAVLLFATAPIARGEDGAGRFELTPYAGYGVGGDFEDLSTGAELELDEASTLGLIVNIQADSHSQWEILYLRQGTKLAAGGLFMNQPILKLDVDYLHGGGTYVLDGEQVQPYVAATIGASRFDPNPSEFDAETYFSFSIGAGLRFRPGKRLGIRLEGRLFATFVDSDSEVFCRTGGASNICAIKVDGSLVSQWHAFTGVTFRF